MAEKNQFTIGVEHEVDVIARNTEEALESVAETMGVPESSLSINEKVTLESEQTDEPQVVLKFHPEQWVNDRARRIQPEGRNVWEMPLSEVTTEENLIPERISYQADALRRSKYAPLWVREYSGPFTVEIVEVTGLPPETTLREYYEENITLPDHLSIGDAIPPELDQAVELS